MKQRKEDILSCLKEGTILGVKIIIVLSIILGASYLLSKLYFRFGIIFYAYFLVFVSPAFIAAPFEDSIIGSIVDSLSVIIFPLYLLIAVNYFYLYFKKNITIWWLTALFVVSTILYIIGILVGLFIFLKE